MKVSDCLRVKIDRLPKGYVFTYEDFLTEVNNKEAVIKALNRMVTSNRIAKLSKGRYYKPENTPFGVLRPGQEQVVKDLLEDNGKVTGYLTGLSVYNGMGLTTQVSNTIQIGKNQVRPKFKRERYTISFIKQKNTITKENTQLLQILDAIRFIKKIPDITTEKACNRLSMIVKTLTKEDKTNIARLALKYPPSTRALLGVILDAIEIGTFTDQLYHSLNPISKYKIRGIDTVLDTTDKWNII